MRLIDADAYAAEMKKRQDACMEAMKIASYDGEQFSPKEHWEGVLVAFAEAKLTLDDMPTIGGWISTKDGLPSRNRVYLITLKTPEGPPQVMEAYLDYGGTWWRGNVSLINEYVTHWMLPPRPQEEDNDHD